VTALRILAFDHFFDQDLAALRGRLDPTDSLDAVSYRRLHSVAARFFPRAAFETLDGASGNELEPAWAAYTRRAVRITDWLAAAYRPSVFVVPNDSFFYLRPVISRFRELRVPTVVVQKETTIAPLTMDIDSQVIARAVPFMSDAMTVCSERHREFAIRCGAPPEAVIVTGQPRFDVYASAAPARTRGPRPTLLYFSFDDLAYLPGDAERTGLGSWRPFREEVETVLRGVADSGAWHVIAKRHPQQLARDDVLGEHVERAEQGADTRALILRADAVLGFQTTALFEAAAAGRPIVYPAWGRVYDATRPLLIPFEDYEGMVTVARSPGDVAALLDDPAALAVPDADAIIIAEQHLGPIDGHAAERVVAFLRERAAVAPLHSPPDVAIADVARAGAFAAAAPAGLAAAAALRAIGRRDTAAGVARTAERWRQRGREARRVRRSARQRV
jgi:hypothetical protein